MRKVDKRQLAILIRDFLTAEGYGLDDLLQQRKFPAEIEPYVRQIFAIHERYSSAQCPIGLADLNAKLELAKLIKVLEGESE
ncbi:MAG: hypothetical protein ACOY99_10880 [Pseudomonadota bacterium]